MADPYRIADQPQAPRSLKYKILCQRHEDYDFEALQRLDDLYVGGDQIKENVRTYLPQLVGESANLYEQRLKTASYINYFAEIVDKFIGDLFAEQPTAHLAPPDGSTVPEPMPDAEFYDAFARDADQVGHTFAEILEETAQRALVQGRGLIVLDLPPADGGEAPETLADEDARGRRRVYACGLPTTALTNWQCDERGEFKWCILSRCELEQDDPTLPPQICEHFKIWRREVTEAGVVVRWETYAIDHDPDVVVRPEDEVPLVGEGVVSFPLIPVMRLEPKVALWVGNKIGDLALEHFQRRSALVNAQTKNLVSIPTVYLGTEVGETGGELPSEAQQNPTRGIDPVSKFERRGYLVLGKDDRVEFTEPSGKTYEVTDRQLDGLKDEMHRVVHMMAAGVNNSTASLGRSGLSKKADIEATAVVLGALGRWVRSFAERVYKMVSDARGEKDLRWQVSGLDTFEIDDRAGILEEAIQVGNIQIESPTFETEYKKRIAGKLLIDVDPQKLETIGQEIADGVKAKIDLMQQMGNEPDGDEGEEPDGDEPPGAKGAKPPVKPVGDDGARTSAE